MSDSMLDENLIATLEQSLRQTRNAQNRLMIRLREVESEADQLRQEIGALDKSGEQTEAAIYSLLATIRSGKHVQTLVKDLIVEDDYEIPAEVRRSGQTNPYLQETNRQNNSNRQTNQNYSGRGYQDNSIAYMNNPNRVPSTGSSIEPVSNRFSDRTITQACTLLLGEYGSPLHVNELYNLLVSGGFEFKGNNPTISIAVSLNRNRRFHKVAPGTFDLVMRDASKAAS